MTENSSQPSARIYQFPVSARRTDSSRQETSALAPQLASRLAVASGSGWYHEAAIEEAKENAKQDAKPAREH